MKVLVKVCNNNIDLYSSKIDGVIIGLKDFSVGFDKVYSIEDIKKIIEQYSKKDIFISINKNIFNSELISLEKKLIELDALNIKGILFYDLSVLYLKQKNNLNVDLVWNQTHMVTNYNTCNYFFNKGVKYAYISPEITLEEILEINEKSNINLFVEVLSYQVMSFSRRRLLTNYYSSINKKYDGKNKTISEKDNKYYIKDNKDGTIIRNGKVFNGLNIINDLIKNNIHYIVVSEDLFDQKIIMDSLDIIDKIIDGSDYKKDLDKINSIIGTNTSFLFNKTIYKVKGEK